MSRLTFDGANRSPVWSPDSKRIAYSNNKTSSNVSGGIPKLLLSRRTEAAFRKKLKWIMIGRMLIAGHVTAKRLLLLFPLLGWDGICVSFRSAVIANPGYFSRQSLMNRSAHFLRTENGSPTFQMKPERLRSMFGRFRGVMANGKSQRERASITSWAADGKTLYYDGPEGIMAVSIAGTHSLTTGQARVLLKGYRGIQAESAVSYDISTDGQHILLTKAKEGAETFQQINVVLNWFDEIQSKITLNH